MVNLYNDDCFNIFPKLLNNSVDMILCDLPFGMTNAVTVLDNTMGSGSTGVACVNTNRNFIGIELDENYFEVAKKRIDAAIEERKNLFTE